MHRRLTVALMRPIVMFGAAPMGRGLAVMQHSIGGHQNACVGAVGTPTQVEVVAEEREIGIEAAQPLP